MILTEVIILWMDEFIVPPAGKLTSGIGQYSFGKEVNMSKSRTRMT